MNEKGPVHKVLLYLIQLKPLDQPICALAAVGTDVFDPERFEVPIIWLTISRNHKLLFLFAKRLTINCAVFLKTLYRGLGCHQTQALTGQMMNDHLLIR